MCRLKRVRSIWSHCSRLANFHIPKQGRYGQPVQGFLRCEILNWTSDSQLITIRGPNKTSSWTLMANNSKKLPSIRNNPQRLYTSRLLSKMPKMWLQEVCSCNTMTLCLNKVHTLVTSLAKVLTTQLSIKVWICNKLGRPAGLYNCRYKMQNWAQV